MYKLIKELFKKRVERSPLGVDAILVDYDHQEPPIVVMGGVFRSLKVQWTVGKVRFSATVDPVIKRIQMGHGTMAVVDPGATARLIHKTIHGHALEIV